MRVILSEAKPPRQVAPSPPRYACHLSRFNGRAYSRKGGFPRSEYYGKIKSDGFAFPGDVSLTLNMTQLSLRDPSWVVAIPAIKVEAAVWSFVPQSSGSPRYARDDVNYIVSCLRL